MPRVAVQYGLLTNDALIVALMQRHRLNHLASNDDDFDRVAAAAGVPERGAALGEALRGRLGRLTARVADIPRQERPRIACLEWLEPGP